MLPRIISWIASLLLFFLMVGIGYVIAGVFAVPVRSDETSVEGGSGFCCMTGGACVRSADDAACRAGGGFLFDTDRSACALACSALQPS